MHTCRCSGKREDDVSEGKQDTEKGTIGQPQWLIQKHRIFGLIQQHISLLPESKTCCFPVELESNGAVVSSSTRQR